MALIFPNLQGTPFVADFSPRNNRLQDIDVSDPYGFQEMLDVWMGPHQWGVGDCLGNRETLLRAYPQAAAGDFDENGHWFYHTHLQVVTAEGLRQGYDRKGYRTRRDLAHISALCPSPLALLRC